MSAQDYNNIKTRDRRDMMNDWEFGVKRQIKVESPNDEPWYVRLPGFRGTETTSVSDLSDLSMRSDSEGALVLQT